MGLMTIPPQPPPEKQPNRPHHIKDWAEKHNLSQAELARNLKAEKGTVSRWYSGTSPSKPWQEKLAKYFECDKEAIFHHPDEWWLSNFIKKLNDEEIERMKTMLKAAFPDKE